MQLSDVKDAAEGKLEDLDKKLAKLQKQREKVEEKLEASQAEPYRTHTRTCTCTCP